MKKFASTQAEGLKNKKKFNTQEVNLQLLLSSTTTTTSLMISGSPPQTGLVATARLHDQVQLHTFLELSNSSRCKLMPTSRF
jgi:hypothetical protein